MTVTPSFSFSPRGRNLLATNVFEPDFPLSERKQNNKLKYHALYFSVTKIARVRERGLPYPSIVKENYLVLISYEQRNSIV